MRDDQPQRVSMIWRKRLTIVMGSQQHSFAVKICQGKVRRVALLGTDQGINGIGERFCAKQEFPQRNPLPLIIKATPTGYAVEVAGALNAWQSIEFFPAKNEWILHQAGDAKIPFFGAEARNGSVVKNRPLQRERLSGRQSALRAHLLLFEL